MRRSNPRRWPATAIAAVLLLSAPALGASDRGKRWSPERWRNSLSKPKYSGTDSSLHKVTAEDGAVLTLTLHLPQGLKPRTKIPTLLEITPYQPLEARRSSPVLGTTRPGSDWSFFVERGAAYVQADARGTGGSEGCLDFGGSLDRSDARVFTKWIRKQDRKSVV